MVHFERIEKSSSIFIQKFDFQQEKRDHWLLESIENVKYPTAPNKRIMSTFFQKLIRTIKHEQLRKVSMFSQLNLSEDLTSVCQRNREKIDRPVYNE